jgi:hypothetical protein
MNRWVPSGYLLMLMSTSQLIDSTLVLKDVLSSEGKCDPNFQYHNLPHNIANQEVALLAPIDTDGLDLSGWRGTNTRNFAIWSAYNLLKENGHQILLDYNRI